MFSVGFQQHEMQTLPFFYQSVFLMQTRPPKHNHIEKSAGRPTTALRIVSCRQVSVG